MGLHRDGDPADVFERIDHGKLLDDDRETLDGFVGGLERLVLGIARRRYRFRQDEAEDLLLEVLRKLWASDKAALRAWRGEGSLKSYLAAITHRFCLMELRRRTHRVTEVEADDLDVFQAAPQPSPAEQAEQRRLCALACAELSTRDRRLLQMRFVEDCDYATITAELDISPGAARKGVHMALTRLRERLREIVPDLFRSRKAR